MKKIFFTLCTFSALFFIPLASDAAPQCDGNRAPNLQDGDPACYTKSTTSSTTTTWEKTGSQFISTCSWRVACKNCSYPCNNKKGGACKATFYSGSGSGCKHTKWCSNMGSPPQYGYYRDTYGYVTRRTTSTSYKCYYRVVDEWSKCDITTGMQSAVSTSQKSRSGTNCQNYHEATTRPCAVCTPGEDIDVTKMPTKTGICAFGNPQMPKLVGENWEWQCLGNYNDIYDDAACSAPNSADGVCGSDATGEYAWNDTAFSGKLCTPGVPSIGTSDFPDYGQEVAWTCDGIGSGDPTEENACVANRLCPEAICGPSDGVATDTRPNINLCISPSSLENNVTLNSDGRWVWNCDYQYNSCESNVPCSAPSCLANTPFELQRYVYFDSDGEPNNATIRVTCPNVCCEIDGQDLDKDDEQRNFICEGDGSAEVEVVPGGSTYDARCWFQDDPDNPVEYDPSVGTMCVARSCNAQGTCQATPQPANSANACTSTCSSDADCSTGRMIETRP